MGPYFYKVSRIDGDYAILIRTDISETDEAVSAIAVARALLPEDIDEGTALKWENLVYTIV